MNPSPSPIMKGYGVLLGLLALLLMLSSNASADDQFNWYHVNGKAKDIGAGKRVWAIGVDPDPHGDWVFLLTGDPHNSAANPWTRMNGQGTRIAVGDDGLAWVVNAQGDIFQAKGLSHDDGFYHVPGKAKDIGAGGGKVWVVGNDPAPPHGDAVFLLTGDPHNSGGNPWTKIGGGGANIAVDGDGNPWVANAQGDIFSAGPRAERGLLGKITDLVVPPSLDCAQYTANPIYAQIVAAINSSKGQLRSRGIVDQSSCSSRKNQISEVISATTGSIPGGMVASDLGRCACKKAY